MDFSRFRFWQKWLTYANILFFLFAIVLAFFSESFIFKQYNTFTNAVFFEGNEMPDSTKDLKLWLTGIIGATLAGYHILMIFISENAFIKKQSWSHRAMMLSLIIWFLIDCYISYTFRAFHNILMVNLVSFIVLMIPLIATRKEF